MILKIHRFTYSQNVMVKIAISLESLQQALRAAHPQFSSKNIKFKSRKAYLTLTFHLNSALLYKTTRNTS